MTKAITEATAETNADVTEEAIKKAVEKEAVETHLKKKVAQRNVVAAFFFARPFFVIQHAKHVPTLCSVI